MKQIYFNITVLAFAFSFYSCGEDIPETSNVTEKVNIYFGSFGGLCGFSDSLTIETNLAMTYNFRIIELCANSGNNEYNTEANLSAADYDQLMDLFSASQFSAMTNNSCARCVDGVDTFLHIEGDDYSHRIVYDQDNEVAEISDLISKLNEIREGLQQD